MAAAVTTLPGMPPRPPTSLSSSPGATVARKCVMVGDGLHTAMARQTASFTIEARDAEGTRQQSGGEIFMVSVRGSSKVTAKVVDNEDGTYRADYKASTSGNYSISVTLNGVALPGSPSPLLVLTPAPDPVRCILRGEALKAAKARELAVFEVEFTDALGQPARAEELDVWVSRAGSSPAGVDDATGSSASSDASYSPLSSPVPVGADSDEGKRRLRTHRQLRRQAIARNGGRVEVGAKPLIMRADVNLDSELVTVLRPSQLVTVLEERAMDDGTIRAKVATVEEEAASKAIADSWWSPFDPMAIGEMADKDGRSASSRALTLTLRSSAESATPAVSSALTLPIGMLAKPPRRGQSDGHGWVTLVKNGAELVAQRPRLNAGERQKHMELWRSREAVDRTLKAQLSSHAATGKGSHVGPSMAQELAADNMNVGFAFGGIHPGTLHAAGKLVKTHSVRYTIGAAGHYKLHVGLRNQAIALPGSPFDLYVAPSAAHAPSTSLPQESLPLRGVVGEEWTCTVTLHVSDRMGNECVTGGAPIVVESENTKETDVESRCIDNEDGSYTLEWRGRIAGSYKTQVKIDNAHVIGSPTIIKMLTGPPDVPKCEISGRGLKTALAGQPAIAQITCKDRYSNPLSAGSVEGSALSFGLALLPLSSQAESRAARDTVASMKFEGAWVKSTEHEGECFEIQYTAKEAGDFELHVWCDPDGSGTRQWLTGSPFSVRVTGVRPSTSGSSVGGVDALTSAPVIAGDLMQLRPQLRDQFGNASSAAEGELEALIEAPDGSHPLELKSLKGLGAYEVSYEVQLKGVHLAQFLLNGEPIHGSPVEFHVSPASAIGSKSRLYPPSEPPQINQSCEILVEAIDKFGNRLERGGSRVDARASGPGVSACTTEDRQDGTYIVSFTAAVVGETRVIVRLDNIEMAPLKLVFVDSTRGEDPAGRKIKGGKSSATLVSGDGTEIAAPAAAGEMP